MSCIERDRIEGKEGTSSFVGLGKENEVTEADSVKHDEKPLGCQRFFGLYSSCY